ncbi:MAG: metal ABC transporter substrate-binding protein [Verrucomicrobiaceae bacterium]|nr:metal ABC transporter substrate-binding protein [Verrucomicrobiaceae bacterium]
MKQTFAICLLFAATLVGCGPSAAPRSSGKKKVLTTFTILADIAKNVAGEAADVESIIKPGAEIHGYEPTPQDLVRAQGADLILWNGLNLEVWFQKFFENLKGVPGVLLTDGITPMSITEGPYSGKPNPHAWMSPKNAMVYVKNIRKALVQLDPANEATYNANASAYTEKLKAIDQPLRDKLSAIPSDRRVLVTSEGAFAYLCASYDLRPMYLWPTNADAQGTPQQVKTVIDGVIASKVPVVFSESTVSDKPARQVASETGAKYGGVLYVDSLTDVDGPAPTFLKLLEHNAETIVKGFSP